MKSFKLILQILIISGFLGMGFVGLSHAQEKSRPVEHQLYAEAPTLLSTSLITSTQSVTATLNPNNITFERLGHSATALRGPFDAMAFSMYLPASWRLTGGTLDLDFTVFFGGVGTESSADMGQFLGGSLEVTFNGKILKNIQLDHDGDYHLTIPITAEAASVPGKNGRHDLRLFLDSSLSCSYDSQTVVTIHPGSRFDLSYQDVPLPTDLRLFPYPFYQQSLLPDVATVVVPDQPTAEELQAALTLVAGLGRLTSGRIELSLVSMSQLTNEIKAATHLILVGKPEHLPILTSLTLPVSAGKAGFELKEAQPDDGLIQVALSPWNSDKLVLVVSGNSDQGVVKAGQAASTGSIRIGKRPDLAVVAEVLPLAEEAVSATPEDQTFSDLGYAPNQVTEKGTNWAVYEFNIPSDKTVTPEAYFELTFNHSALLDYDQSSMVISLNDETIASVNFSDESTKAKIEKIGLPRHAIRSGVNTLLFRMELLPKITCTNPNANTLWLKIWPESVLHLPLTDKPTQVVDEFDLNKYPAPFVPNPTLGNMALVLSPGDPASWQTAAQLAFDLGRRSDGPLTELKVLFGNNIPDKVRREHHLLIIGKASRLPIMAELHNSLPAPFEPASDLAKEENVNIIYRFSQGTDMGYIELLPAPWAKNRVVMAVLGSTNIGLNWAAQALIAQDLQNQLSGNFAVINDKQVVVGNIRTKPLSPGVATPALTATHELTQSVSATTTTLITNTNALTNTGVEIPPGDAPSASKRDAWFLSVLATSIGLMIVVIILAVLTARRQ